MFASFFFQSFPFFEFFKIINFRGSFAKLKETNPKTNWRVSSLIFPKNLHWKHQPPPIRNFDRLSFPLLFLQRKEKLFSFFFFFLFCHLPLTAEEYKDDPDKQIGRHTFSPAHPNKRKREEKRIFFERKKSRSWNWRVVVGLIKGGIVVYVLCSAVQYFFSSSFLFSYLVTVSKRRITIRPQV